MQIIEPYVIVESTIDNEILERIEKIGRVCWKSEDKTTDTSALKFIKMLIEKGHESVLEHESITVRFVIDRGVSHELVRHRLCAFSQESTRYCNYSKDKFGNELTFIKPFFFSESDSAHIYWMSVMQNVEWSYKQMMLHGVKPEEARSILPNSIKTEIVVTTNLREWRHILKLRTSNAAHPQMRQIMIPLLDYFKEKIPVIFDDIIPGTTIFSAKVWEANE